jgi:hypothetical protein
MADHARAQDLAAISLDFDLTVGERAELDGHLDACPACREHLEGLRLDARAFADLPRRDAPERVRRRIAPDPRPAPRMRLRLAVSIAGVLVVAVVVFTGTGGLRSGGDEPGATEPPGVAVASPSATGPASTASQVAPASRPPATPRPDLPATAWQVLDDRSAFNVRAVTPRRDTSSPPPLPCQDCGDTSVPTRRSVVGAAVETDDGIVAVGHGCFGGTWVTCQADVWLSADGRDWQAVPHDPTLDAGSDVWVGRPTGMVDVVVGPRGLVAGGAVSAARGVQATIWVSPDGRRWEPMALAHEGEGRVAAVAAGPARLVAVGRVRTVDGLTAAAWVSSDGATWEPAASLDGAAVGRFTGDDQDVAGMFDVTWAGDRFVAVGARCSSLRACRVASWTSPDGMAWSRATSDGPVGRMRSVASLGSSLVAVGDDGTWDDAVGRVWTSADAINWVPAAIGAGVKRPAVLRAVVAIDAGAIAAGDGYAIGSTDGRSWVRSDDGALAGGIVHGLTAGATGVIATGRGTPVEVRNVWEHPPVVWHLPYR